MHLSKGGLSLSAGARGASVNVGRRGASLNTGIPGTGLSARTQLASSAKARTNSRGATAEVRPRGLSTTELQVSVDDEGALHFRDSNGADLAEQTIAAAKKQQGPAIQSLIEKKCEEINSQIDVLGQMHVETPAPEKPRYVGQTFDQRRPSEPSLEIPGLLAKLIKSRAAAIEQRNVERMAKHSGEVNLWEQRRREHDAAEAIGRSRIEKGIYDDTEVMSQFLEERLQEIEWPRETLVSAEIVDGGRVVYLDVDLPEIEDLPRAVASVPQRGLKLTVKELSEAKHRQLYMQHVHGIGFRIIGEAFAALPVASEVTLSAYSQRPDRATGQVVDQYLYSVTVDRDRWSSINFSALADVDVVEGLARFNLRRKMTKTGIFTPVEPFAPPT
jgi:hypothetical protein